MMVMLNIENKADRILREVRELKEFVEDYTQGPGKTGMLTALDEAETQICKVKLYAGRKRL